MNPLYSPLLIMVVYVALLLLAVGVARLWRKRQIGKRRSPLSQLLLRSPGESLNKELDDAFSDALLYLLMVPTSPLIFYSMHISQSYWGNTPETLLRTVADVGVAIAVTTFALVKLMKQVGKVSKLRQGCDAEKAVGQELNLLMREGAHVFHDVPADGFNIDHVIVSQKGVFAVETKSRLKPDRDKGAEDARVVFDGQKLNFPTWSESAPLEQAARQARWLGKWLSDAVGDKVEAKPMLALPGWFVDLKARGGVYIINGKNVGALFGKLPPTALTDSLVKQIAHQLENRCRDVAPGLYVRQNRISQ